VEELPPDVEAELAQGVGAYLRTAPAQQIPPVLRRFRGLRPQALGRHRDSLVAVIDDPVVRRQISEWLKKRPKLPAERSRILSVAVERPEGWKAELRSLSRVGPDEDGDTRASEGRFEEALELERAKTRRAREEARRARDEARRQAEEDRVRLSELSRTTKDLERRLDAALVAEGAATRRAEEAERELERSRRRSRRLEDRAREERDSARGELKRARRDVASLSGRVAALEGAGALPVEKPRPTPRKDRPEPAVRVPLAVPKGLLEDDAETLAQWLRIPGVTLLVDGYNVTLAEGGFGNVQLEGQRDRLIHETRNLAVRYKARAIIVFDGDEMPPGTSRRSRGPVEVEYSTSGESADDHLVALLGSLPNHPVIVVTRDRALQDRALGKGATIASSNQLLELFRRHAPR
jgi:predicted RNA-binding protein with PIN domain